MHKAGVSFHVLFHWPDPFRVCPDDVGLQIQQVVMVIETGQSVQPQQGHAELSAHFFQFSSADVKTLKRAHTCSLNTLTWPVEATENIETFPHSDINATMSWKMNIDAHTKKEFPHNPAVASLKTLALRKQINKNFSCDRMCERYFLEKRLDQGGK